ncbi:MAG: MFS transporter [Spirochaetia bacterium]|nr:MFS transporter [Spirochaetia bacterium]MCF7941715.1 MFS transporter [Spirochaetia bacterium]
MKIKRIDIASSAALFIYAASMVITPICLISMAREFSFTYSGGGALGGVKSFLILAALLASGFIASLITKRIAVGLGMVIVGLSLIGAGLSPSYEMVLICMVIMGLGSGLIEALTNPLVHDAHPLESNKYLNYVNAFYSIGVVVTVILTGFLLSYQVPWRALFIGTGIIAVLSSILFFPPDDQITESGESVRWKDWAQCFSQPIFWVLALAIFFGGAAEAAFTFWSASYIQVHFTTLADAAGIGTGIFALAMAIGRIGTGKMTRGHHGDRWLLLWASVLGFIVSIGVYLTPSIAVFYLMLFFSGLAVAPYWPTIQSVSTSFVSGDHTLLFILLSCAGIPGIGFATWIMGYFGDLYGLQKALIVIPVSYAILIASFILLLHMTKQQQKS